MVSYPTQKRMQAPYCRLQEHGGAPAHISKYSFPLGPCLPWLAHIPSFCSCPSSEPLLWAFSADGGMADFSPLGSDLCSLAGAPLTTLAEGVGPHCHSFLSNHLTVEALKSQPAPGIVCTCRCLFISAGTWSLLFSTVHTSGGGSVPA